MNFGDRSGGASGAPRQLFRQSHELVGQAVKRAEALDIPLGSCRWAEFQTISPEFGVDAAPCSISEQSVERRDVYGGTSQSRSGSRSANFAFVLEMTGWVLRPGTQPETSQSPTCRGRWTFVYSMILPDRFVAAGKPMFASYTRVESGSINAALCPATSQRL